MAYVYKNNTYYIDNGEVKTGWLTYQYNGKKYGLLFLASDRHYGYRVQYHR